MSSYRNQRPSDVWGQKASRRRDKDHPAYRHVIDYVCGKFQRELSRAKSVLDVGCGTGNFVLTLKSCRPRKLIVGIDSSQDMAQVAGNLRAEIVVGDALDLPFPDSSFEVVICMGLLHHVNDIETSVKEMKRVASRAVLACEPNLYSPLQWLSALRPHERQAFACTPGRLTRIFREEFKSVDIRFGGFVAENLTPLWLLRTLQMIEPFIDRYAAKPLSLGIYLAGEIRR